MIQFRTLKKDEIEVRCASAKNGKTTLLLYIDSRAAGKLLDETVGQENWQISYYSLPTYLTAMVNGVSSTVSVSQVFGHLGIKDKETGEWIFKDDTGEASGSIPSPKALASDILKRCLVRWGVNELYSAPRIVINGERGKEHFSVSDITYDDSRRITKLSIVDTNQNLVYSWERGQEESTSNVSGVSQPMQVSQTSQPCFAQSSITATDMAENRMATFQNYCTCLLNSGCDPYQVNRFRSYWEPKMQEFTGKLDCEKLWKKHIGYPA